MTHDTRTLALRWFDEIWNQRRGETIDELWGDDAHGEIEGSDERVSREGFRAHWNAFHSAIANLHVAVEDVLSDGPSAVVKWRLTGTHVGEGLGAPPSGRPVDFTGVTWLKFREGQFVWGFDKWNRGEVMASLMQVPLADLRERFALTPRQAQVALLLAERKTHKEIARELEISPNTARLHCQNVLRKLGIHSKSDVAAAIAAARANPVARAGDD